MNGHDSGTFSIAQTLRQSHCDRRDNPHECVGEMTIKRGEICLNCKLCGKGEEIPGWNHADAKSLSGVFKAAGIEWECLDLESRRNAIIEYQKGCPR